MNTQIKKFGDRQRQNKLITDVKRETAEALKIAKKTSKTTPLNQIIISGKDKGMQNKLIRLTEKMNNIVSERPRAFESGHLKPKSEVEVPRILESELLHNSPPH